MITTVRDRMHVHSSHQTSGSFSWRCWSPVVMACPLERPRLALASRRPELAVVLVVRSFHCTYSLLCCGSSFCCTFLLWSFRGVSIAERTDTVSSGVQDVLRHRCSRPPLQLRASVLPRRLRCRSVNHTDAPLNQFVGPSHENSLA